MVGGETKGTNNKVGKLCRLAEEARYPLLIITDSDVRVAPEYLRKVAAQFKDPQVGAVTALYRAIEAPSFGAIMDTMGSLSFSGSALAASSLEGLKFTMGSTAAIPRERLAEIGGFAPLLDMHSDDYELGRRVAEKGYRVELTVDPVDMEFPSESLGDYLRHELRWLVGLRHIRPGGHFGLLMTQGIAWAAAAAILAPSWTARAVWILAYLAVRLFSGYVVGVWGLGDPVVRRKLWLLPLHEISFGSSSGCEALQSTASNRRGLALTLEKGQMDPGGVPPARRVRQNRSRVPALGGDRFSLVRLPAANPCQPRSQIVRVQVQPIGTPLENPYCHGRDKFPLGAVVGAAQKPTPGSFLAARLAIGVLPPWSPGPCRSPVR